MADDQPFLLPLVVDDTPDAEARVPDLFRERQWMRVPDGELPPEVIGRLARVLASSSSRSSSGATASLVSGSKNQPQIAALKTPGLRAQAAAAPSHRLGVCVLPFANMSGDPEQEYFSAGITEDVITDLSKISALWVAARNTAFTFKGKNVDVLQVARQLKASHVLEGSVRKAGRRVRITAQLIDGATGGHVWAERYDRDLDDIFALQDQGKSTIVSARSTSATERSAPRTGACLVGPSRVAQGGGDDTMAGFVFEGTQADLHRKLCAIPTLPKERQSESHRARTRVLHVMLSMLYMPGAKTFRHQLLDAVADDLLMGTAEKSADLSIGKPNHPRGIDDDGRIRCGIQHVPNRL